MIITLYAVAYTKKSSAEKGMIWEDQSQYIKMLTTLLLRYETVDFPFIIGILAPSIRTEKEPPAKEAFADHRLAPYRIYL